MRSLKPWDALKQAQQHSQTKTTQRREARGALQGHQSHAEAPRTPEESQPRSYARPVAGTVAPRASVVSSPPDTETGQPTQATPSNPEPVREVPDDRGVYAVPPGPEGLGEVKARILRASDSIRSATAMRWPYQGGAQRALACEDGQNHEYRNGICLACGAPR